METEKKYAILEKDIQKLTNLKIQNAIHNIILQRDNLLEELKLGIINEEECLEQQMTLTKKERNLKEQLVLKNHITKTGNIRAITFNDKKQLYMTRLEDKTIISAKTYDSIIDKLYILYGCEEQRNTIINVFNLAIKEKELDNAKSGTIKKNKNDFKRYIDESFMNKEIKSITDEYIKSYSLNLIKKQSLNTKQFLAYKGILNLIFDYAIAKHLITQNILLGFNTRNYLASCNQVKQTKEKLFTPDEINAIKKEVQVTMLNKKYNGYCQNGFMVLMAIETGMRVAELCSLKWEDVYINHQNELVLHIHSQLLTEYKEGHCYYYIVEYTKNEKGISNGGREFPVTDNIYKILQDIKELQEKFLIKTPYIFGDITGSYTTTRSYMNFLRRLCRRIGLSLTNNHSFRMSLNSNVLVPLNIDVAKRSYLLGHTVETNLRFYTHVTNDCINIAKTTLNNYNLGKI